MLHQYDREGHTPLHWAALGGHSHVVRFFIECRAPVDMPARNELGSQPIHWAGNVLLTLKNLENLVIISTRVFSKKRYRTRQFYFT